MSELVYITVDQHPRVDEQAPSKSQTHPDWIHPHLLPSTDPLKGRQFRASHLIPKGTRLLIDRPYAVIPVVDDPSHNKNLICSNPRCNRPSAPHRDQRRSCPNNCVADVAWCSSACRETDQPRHAFECPWLKRYASSIRSRRDEYTFGVLWVIVRLLATRHWESPGLGLDDDDEGHAPRRWGGIDSLCGSVETWPLGQVRAWRVLVKKYLQDSPVLPHGLSAERVLRLICQEEANSFGLYPRETGVLLPSRGAPVDRGEQFAAAVYPTAAIANHSCVPNVRRMSPGSPLYFIFFSFPSL